jgi:hypothetical protein
MIELGIELSQREGHAAWLEWYHEERKENTVAGSAGA